MTGDNKLCNCRLKGQFRIHGIRTTNPVAVGDHVEFKLEGAEENGIITAIEPRTNYIVRRSINLSKTSHIIASNIDRLYIVASIMLPRTSTGFIDRLLVTAEAYHIPAAVIFNKIDTLILTGGGMRDVCIIGALNVLEKKKNLIVELTINSWCISTNQLQI